MALLVGMAIGGAIGTIAIIFRSNRWTDITNMASRSVLVSVDGDEQTIKTGCKRRFKVKQATPVNITVKFLKSENSDVELTFQDYGHGNHTVADYGYGGLRII